VIRVNLAPPAPHAPGARLARVALAFGVMSLGVPAGLGGWHAALMRAEAELIRQVAILSHERDTLAARLGDGRDVRDALADLSQRARAIEELARGRDAAMRLVDAVLDAVPGDLWFTSLDARGPDLRLTGWAASPRAIADFTSRLRASGFTSVEIVRSRQDLGARPPEPLTFEVAGRFGS
jgi:Tfp pilus assembly protein PilN